MKSSLFVGLAGAAGALSRYLLGLLIQGFWPSPMPWGTLVINLTGSFLLGLLTGLGLHRGLIPPAWRIPLTTGFIGAYTTFSTWAVDTVLLAETGHIWAATANVMVSIGLGLPLAALGLRLSGPPQAAESDPRPGTEPRSPRA
ncbi:MAG: putative transrane protein [Symbiobacteriaceae bacterium]|jgi:CrcB protein|nr:putative transrane protein [Symbiobacteriaceae bacterium]